MTFRADHAGTLSALVLLISVGLTTAGCGSPHPDTSASSVCPARDDSGWLTTTAPGATRTLVPGDPVRTMVCVYSRTGAASHLTTNTDLDEAATGRLARSMNASPPITPMRCPGPDPQATLVITKYQFDYTTPAHTVVETGRSMCPPSITNGFITRGTSNSLIDSNPSASPTEGQR